LKNIIFSTVFDSQRIDVQGVSIEYDYLPYSLNDEQLQIETKHGAVTGAEIVAATGKYVDFDEPTVNISVSIYGDGVFLFDGELTAKCVLETKFERFGYTIAFGFDTSSGSVELAKHLHNEIWSTPYLEAEAIMAYIGQAYSLESEIRYAIDQMNNLLDSYLESIETKT
jgi:hypothetical protein